MASRLAVVPSLGAPFGSEPSRTVMSTLPPPGTRERNRRSLRSLGRRVARDTLIHALAPLSDRMPREKPRIRVIALHSIPVEMEQRFNAKLRWLTRSANLVSLRDLYHRNGIDRKRLNVALTFDDGFKDVATVVAPALREFGVPATFFVPSGAVGLTGGAAGEFALNRLGLRSSVEFLDASDVRALAEDPLFEIGGHAVNHGDLGASRSRAYLEGEILKDKQVLEDMAWRRLHWFAFPFGQYSNASSEALQVIRDAGYLASFTIVPSFWTTRRNGYLLGRDSLSVWHSNALWRDWLRGGYDGLSSLKGRRAFRALQPLPEGA